MTLLCCLKSSPGATAAVEDWTKKLELDDRGVLPYSSSESAFTGAGGSYNELHRLTLSDSRGKILSSLIVKSTPRGKREQTQSIRQGLAREAMFFNALAPKVEQLVRVPKVLYAEGDLDTGEKIIIMEDLKDVTQTGYFFGPGSPLNHEKDLKEICERAGNPHCKEVAAATFRAAAELHARYWEDESLLKLPWLRGSSWVTGLSEESWRESQRSAIDQWKIFLQRCTDGAASVAWPQELISVVDASLRKVSWEDHVRAKRPWTLVHGDFHPANIMWWNGTSESGLARQKVVFLDWELVGLGSGPQELGQYLTSHMDPVCRKECEEELVRDYYNHLVSVFPESKACTYTWDECWSEYKAGCAERWMWLKAFYAGDHGVEDLRTFFLGQVGAFLQDHNITADTIGQPRP